MKKEDKDKSICFAYYIDKKWAGWYGGTFGSVSKSPKVYNYSENQVAVVTKNFRHKLEAINETSFDEQIEIVKGIAALSLLKFDSEDVLRDKEVELRIVECPIYDGPNPDFDDEAYKKLNNERHAKMVEAGVFDIPGPSIERRDAVKKFPSVPCDNWIYADWKEVNAWAENEPTEFLEVIKSS